MTERTIQIRRATLRDLSTIAAFNAAMAMETEEKELDPATLSAGVRQAIQDPARCLYFVAEVDGVVAGQTMVTFEWCEWRNGFVWWIQSVYVDPRFRRCGLFRALYAHIKGLARKQADVRGIRLYVRRDNDPALQTYRKLGMESLPYDIYEEDWSQPS